ncbi:hypothetical protein M758_10G039500 [Ceratodon purpureus]|nr:hypothetical protein M758_10G039500 [Ceratodon purpureus]
MTAGCARSKWDRQPPGTTNNTGNNNNTNTTCNNSNNKQQNSKDVFAELSRVGCEAAYVLALKARISNLHNRLEALEKHNDEEKIKQNKFVLRELVKEARARILEQANVNLRLWPEIVEILSPSAVKLNDWVHGYTTWQAARIIEGMNSKVQSTWAELFKMTHSGESFEDYTKLDRPTMAEELHEHE